MENKIIQYLLDLINSLPIVSKISVVVLLSIFVITKKLRSKMLHKFVAFLKKKLQQQQIIQENLNYHDLFINEKTYLRKAEFTIYEDPERRFIFHTILKEKIKAINKYAREIITVHKLNTLEAGRFKCLLINTISNIVKEYNDNIKEILRNRYKEGSAIYELVMNKQKTNEQDTKVGFNVWHEYMVEELKEIVINHFFATTLNSYNDHCEIGNDFFHELDRACRFAIYHCEKIYNNFNGNLDILIRVGKN